MKSICVDITHSYKLLIALMVLYFAQKHGLYKVPISSHLIETNDCVHFGGICLSFFLDFKFMTVSKKNIEDASILNVHFRIIHNKRLNIYPYLRSKFYVDRILYLANGMHELSFVTNTTRTLNSVQHNVDILMTQPRFQKFHIEKII